MADPEATHNWQKLDNRITTPGQPTELGSSLWLTMSAGLLLCLIFAKVYRPRPHEGRMEAAARELFFGPPDRRRE